MYLNLMHLFVNSCNGWCIKACGHSIIRQKAPDHTQKGILMATYVKWSIWIYILFLKVVTDTYFHPNFRKRIRAETKWLISSTQLTWSERYEVSGGLPSSCNHSSACIIDQPEFKHQSRKISERQRSLSCSDIIPEWEVFWVLRFYGTWGQLLNPIFWLFQMCSYFDTSKVIWQSY